jgi:cell wall-associated NlpC family hydrolase
LPRAPGFPKLAHWGLIGLLTLILGGCAGERPKPQQPPPPPPSAPAEVKTPADERLREAISQYLGTCYKYGGTTKDGIDCSGFVMKTFERAGVSVPRTSELQFQQGQKVSPDDLKYGDLLFFNNYCYSKYSFATASILSGVFAPNNQPCHVGIYIGSGRFIHSTASQGGVTISNVNSDCWKRSLIGVRRYLPQ